MAILEPIAPLMEEEAAALGNWLEEGGRLLVAVPPRRGAPAGKEKGVWLDDWFQQPSSAGPAAAGGAAADELTLADDPLLAGVRHPEFTLGTRFDPQQPLAEAAQAKAPQVLISDFSGGLLVRARRSQGEIVALADAYPLSNRGLREGDNALLLANLAQWLAGDERGRVGFDEYHHGFVEREMSPVAMLRLLLAGPWALAVLQAAAVAALALWATGVRFGKPRDLAPVKRRRQREFAEAAGGLLAEARATRFLHDTLARFYRERMCRHLKLPLDVPDRELVAALRRAADVPITWIPPPADQRAELGPVSEEHVLRLVAQWRQAVGLLEAPPAATARRSAIAGQPASG